MGFGYEVVQRSRWGLLVFALFLASLFASSRTFAQPFGGTTTRQDDDDDRDLNPLAPLPQPWEHESEASAIITSGNTQTETYNVRQSTTYTFDENALIADGRYRLQSDRGERTAQNWKASLRYERSVSFSVSLYVGRLAESDIYAGIVQRDSTDLGVKYYFVKRESKEIFVEAGYRPSFENRLSPARDRVENFGRTYVEWRRVWSKNLSTRFWVEYLPNLRINDDFLLSAEPSVDSKLTSIFALRVSYLFKYRGLPLPNTVAKDTVFSTTLVARF